MLLVVLGSERAEKERKKGERGGRGRGGEEKEERKGEKRESRITFWRSLISGPGQVPLKPSIAMSRDPIRVKAGPGRRVTGTVAALRGRGSVAAPSATII